MLKPKIAVVNSSSELAVCFAHLDGVAKVVKEAIRAAGGIPFEVRTTAPSDFITGAGKSGSYILAARDLVTNDIEAQVEAAVLDGMICLTSCDKTPPGHLMAAARLDIPTLLVIGGYQASGMIGDDHVDIEDLFSGSVGATLGKPGKHSIDEMAEQAIRGPGVCAGMATANTMHCVVEALGMSLPGSAPVRANSDRMFDCARRSGTRIVEMVNEGLTPRQILTEGAFRNAAAMVLGVAGSINAIKHLQATATEGADRRRRLRDLGGDGAEGPGAQRGQAQRQGADRAVRGRRRRRGGAQAARADHRHLGPDLHRQDAGRKSRGRDGRRYRHHPPARQPDLRRPLDRDPQGLARARERGGEARHPRRVAPRGVRRHRRRL